MTLPQIVDLRAQGCDELPEVRASELSWDNPYAWRILYRSVYEDGQIDSRLHGRAMAGRGERDALIRLQKLESGFAVVRILLYAIRPPATPGQVEELERVNRQLRRERERGHGRYGHETQTQAGPGPAGDEQGAARLAGAAG